MHWATRRADERPPCLDNNYTLNALSTCAYPNGSISQYCVQVGYSHNAFIAQCSTDDPHCGTYLEIHMPNGSPYQSNETIIADVRIQTSNVSGVYTTVIPLTWQGNSSRVLCAYAESFYRIGTVVYVKSNAPICCCPGLYSTSTRTGLVVCPKGPTGNGAFAYYPKSILDQVLVDGYVNTYPYCPQDMRGNDSFHCSIYDSDNQRNYVTNCSRVSQKYEYLPYSFTSPNLVGKIYGGNCSYFDVCASTKQDGKCSDGDYEFSFIGRVGIVTRVDLPTVWVSFNDGRTSYSFDESSLKIETVAQSMYGKLNYLTVSPRFQLFESQKFGMF